MMTMARDGRNARRDRGVGLVVDATVDLVAHGDHWPTAAAIAARSGMSLRTVFRYFDDMTVLMTTAFTAYRERLEPWTLPAPPPDMGRHERVDRLVTHHLALAARTGEYRDALAAHATRNPALHQLTTETDERTRANIKDWCSFELDHIPARSRSIVLAAITASLHPDHIARLHRYGLTDHDTAHVLTTHINTTLDHTTLDHTTLDHTNLDHTTLDHTTLDDTT